MGFINVLKNGEIPPKQHKKKKITPYDTFMAKKRPTAFNSSLKTLHVDPKSCKEAESIVAALLSGKGVMTDFTGLDPVTEQRILDFLSGAAFAIDGKIEKITQSQYLITPKNIVILSEEQ